MYALYKKSCQSPLRVAAYLKATIVVLGPLMKAAEPHSSEDKELRKLRRQLQYDLDAALKAHMQPAVEQFEAGILTYEEYAGFISDGMHRFEEMQIGLRTAI